MLNGLKHLTVGLIEVPSIPNPLLNLRRPGFDLTAPTELDLSPVQAEESREIDRLLDHARIDVADLVGEEDLNEDHRLWPQIQGWAEELGLTTRAIRFYEVKGLIAPDRRGMARCYTRRDRARIQLILRGKNLGFTLEDIKEYLELYDADPAHRAQLKLLAAKVDAHIADLDRKRADIERDEVELFREEHNCSDDDDA